MEWVVEPGGGEIKPEFCLGDGCILDGCILDGCGANGCMLQLWG